LNDEIACFCNKHKTVRLIRFAGFYACFLYIEALPFSGLFINLCPDFARCVSVCVLPSSGALTHQTQSTAPQDEHHTTKYPHGIECSILKAMEEDVVTTIEL
jgi:hypothetical protein